MRILLLEDDARLGPWLKKNLTDDGNITDLFSDGIRAELAIKKINYEILIIDRMTPGIDGLSLVKKIRSEGNNIPVIFLTALNEIENRLEGFEAGADDYLAKPFSFSELLARIEVLVRRTNPEVKETSLKVGSLIMNLLTRQVHRNGIEIELQPREFRLLEFLMRRSNQVVTRTMLLEGVWEYHFDPQTNVITLNFDLRNGGEKTKVIATYHPIDSNTMAVCIVEVRNRHPPTLEYGNMYRVQTKLS